MALIKNSFSIILLFMLIFGFRLPIVYNSAILVLFISIFIIFFSKKLRLKMAYLIKSRYLIRIFSSLTLLFIVSVLIPIFHNSNDFTILKGLFGILLTLMITLFVYVSISSRLNKKTDIIKYIIIVFFIQSLIQILALVSPSFLSIIQYFQPQNVIEIAGSNYYQGLRGLSLSTEQFFGLSTAYGLVIIFYTKYILDERKMNVPNIMIILILLTSAFFVGRTVVIGLSFSILYFIFYAGNVHKLKFIYKIFMMIVMFSVIIFNLLNNELQQFIVDIILPQVFDIYSNSKANSSLSRLYEMLSISINEMTFILGDGLYMKNGHYYMHTDSGYFRQLLYGGMFFVLLNFIYQIFYFLYGKLYFTTRREKKNFFLFSLLIFLYLSVLHVKGEVIGSGGKMLMVILMLYGINVICFYKKKGIHEN